MESENQAVTAFINSNPLRKRRGLPAWADWARPNDGAPSVRGIATHQQWVLSFLLALALTAATSVIGLTHKAAAQGLNPLQAHLGFLGEKPAALPLALPPLQLSHTEGTASYAVTAPRSATGITLIVNVDPSSKVTVERYNAPDGKKLKRKAWSRKQRSKRLHILSFDGLGLGENTIQILVRARGNPKHTKSYDVTVTRAATLGSDATLTALGLSGSGLTPAFARDTKSYETSVVYRVTVLGVAVRRKEAGTVVQLHGTGSDGTELAVKEMTVSGLTVGRNTVAILATAEDGSMTENYNIAVFRLGPSSDATLNDLTMLEGAAGLFGFDLLRKTGGGILRPAFSRQTKSYEASVPANVTAVRMAATGRTISAFNQSGRASDGTPLAVRTSDVTLTRSGAATQRRIITFAGLQVGRNTIEVQVTAEDGVTKGAYKVTVTRESEQLRQAAEQGDARAQTRLGNMYYGGRSPQDFAEAVKWYRLAAEQGYAIAQYNLGIMYDTGRGVPQDDQEAVKWYRLAAEQGYATAQYNLGAMYATGRGVPQDFAEAVRWYRKAAEQGHAGAQTTLGFMYDKGEGVPQDIVRGHAWISLAAAQGDEKASELKGSRRETMTAEQVAEAEKLAAELYKRIESSKSQ